MAERVSMRWGMEERQQGNDEREKSGMAEDVLPREGTAGWGTVQRGRS